MFVLSVAALGGCQHAGPSLVPQQAAATATTRGTSRQLADVRIAGARLMEQRGETTQALAAYREALKQDPSRGDAALRIAALLDQQGRFTDSMEYYRKAQAALPNDPGVACNLGYSLYLQHRWPEAEAVLRKALVLAPEHQRAHNNLGLVLVQLGRNEEALIEFGRAGCSESDAHLNLAFALMLARSWPEAKAHYERALAADPSSTAAREGLQELTALLARLDKAPESASTPLASSAASATIHPVKK